MPSKYLFLTASICLLSSNALADSEQERTVSRITALWKDAQIQLVKEQAESFLKEHPNGEGAQIVRMALADSYRLSKDYEKALQEIQKIPEDEQTLDIKLIYIDALYQLKNYSAVCAHTKAILNVIDFESNVGEKKALISAYAGLSYLAQHQMQKTPDPKSKELEQAQLLLTQTDLCPKAWKPLVKKAQIQALQLQGRLAEAGQKANELAQSEDTEKEPLLFLAAQSFADSEPEKSIAIYEKLIKEEGALFEKAAKSLMQLLIQKEDYSGLIDRRHVLKKSLPNESEDALTFFLAEAYFQRGDYLKVFHLLKEPLKQLTPAQKRRMHVLAGYAAHKIGNTSHTKKCLDALFEHRELSLCETELALIWAKHALEESDPKGAERTLVQLKKRRYPEEKAPSIALLTAAIAYQSDRIDEAFNLSIDLLEEGSVNEKDASLLTDILSACAKKSIHSAKGSSNDTLERFMTFVELQETPKNARLILSYLDALTAYSKFEKMHYFLSHLPIEQMTFSSSERFYLELKKALAYEKMAHFDDEISALKRAYKAAETLGNSEKMQVLIFLFNANYRLHKLHCTQNKQEVAKAALERAASYLRAAYELEPTRIDPKNKRWLAYFYSDYLNNALRNTQMQMLSTDELRRAYTTLQSISQDDALDQTDQAKIALSTVKLGRESSESSTKYLSISLDLSSAVNLIEKSQALEKCADYETQKLKSALYLEAGRIYDKFDMLNEAKECFEKAKGAALLGVDADLAKLFLCRINLKENAIDASEAIGILKDLQHKKSASHEPLFLEAALDYIEASCMELKGLEKMQKKLFLLNRFKEDFCEVRSATGRSYHESLESLPEKKALYTKYMGFIDQEIAYLELQLNAPHHPETKAKAIEEIQASVDALKKMHVDIESYAQIDQHLNRLNTALENAH